jgi:hypothetical protein
VLVVDSATVRIIRRTTELHWIPYRRRSNAARELCKKEKWRNLLLTKTNRRCQRRRMIVSATPWSDRCTRHQSLRLQRISYSVGDPDPLSGEAHVDGVRPAFMLP